MSLLLLYPPSAKIAEPPAGIARLAGSLRENGIRCITYDLNEKCILQLFSVDSAADDTWSRRAYKHRHRHLEDLRSFALYRQPERYLRAVKDLNRVISSIGRSCEVDLSLSNYTERNRSPLKSSDLLSAATHYQSNLFFLTFKQHVDNLISDHRPSFVGISFTYLSQVLTGFAILGYIKEVYPEIKTIAGGGVITSWMSNPNFTDRFSPYIDHLVAGPGEQPLLTLLGRKPEKLPGTPDYSDVDFNSYLSPGPILPYAASDGCYWQKCTFCPDHAEKSCFSHINPDRVLVELSALSARHHPSLIHFLDNAMSPSLMNALAQKPLGIPWYGFSRFEKELEDLDFCYALKMAGCAMLKLGLESGSQNVLDRMNKGINLDRAHTILENLRRAGIATYIYLLFGTPYETEKEARLTANFVEKHHQAITFLNLAIFNMPVCSAEAHALPNRFSDGDLSLYCDFDHPYGWDRKSVRLYLQNEFRKNPLINSIIQRDPPFFTSNHAPLFCLHGQRG